MNGKNLSQKYGKVIDTQKLIISVWSSSTISQGTRNRDGMET